MSPVELHFVQVCDAIEDDSSNAAKFQTIIAKFSNRQFFKLGFFAPFALISRRNSAKIYDTWLKRF